MRLTQSKLTMSCSTRYKSKFSTNKIECHNSSCLSICFEESKINTKYIGDVGAFELDRRKTRSESQVETQKAIIEGMKAAGSIRARGGTGEMRGKSVRLMITGAAPFHAGGTASSRSTSGASARSRQRGSPRARWRPRTWTGRICDWQL